VDEQFKAEVQVLAESVTHHVKEEESTIFALARQMLEPEELQELGAEMEAAQKRLMRSQKSPSRKRAAPKKSSRKTASRRAVRR
jgi:hemerythrin-like domain-containing protein